jgi:hypothetical protein
MKQKNAISLARMKILSACSSAASLMSTAPNSVAPDHSGHPHPFLAAGLTTVPEMPGSQNTTPFSRWTGGIVPAESSLRNCERILLHPQLQAFQESPASRCVKPKKRKCHFHVRPFRAFPRAAKIRGKKATRKGSVMVTWKLKSPRHLK